MIRLIQKWFRAGVLEDGIVTIEERGTGQGSVISPLIANIYLLTFESDDQVTGEADAMET